MKLVFVNRYYAPDISATSQLLTDLARHLAERGSEVHVVTSRQLYSDAEARLPAEAWDGAVRVHRVWTTSFGRLTLSGRAFDYVTFHASVARTLGRLLEAGDVVIAETDPPMISVVAAWAARRRKAHLVNWLQDLFPEVAQRLGIPLLGSLPGRYIRHLRDHSLRAASMNVVLGERMAERVRGLADGTLPLAVIHNWSDGRFIAPRDVADHRLRREWGVTDRFIVGYSGNMGRAHEFETLLDAADRLRDLSDLLFVLIGGGRHRFSIEEAVRSRGLERSFRFEEYQPRERLPESLTLPDLHLVSLRPELEGLIVPSKFYGIAAAARAILFVGDVDGEIARIVREAECGIAVPTGDGAALAREVRELHSDRARARALGANARRVFEARFDKPHAMRRWEDVLERAAERRV